MDEMLMRINDTRIIQSPAFIKGHKQNRGHKKKRINKKWLKKYGVIEIVDENIYMFDGAFYCHPKVAAHFETLIKSYNT